MSSFNENDLIAFHLHELSPERARALQAALETDPQLAADSEAIAATLTNLRDGSEPEPVSAAVSDHHWRRLRPALVEAQGSAFGWWKPFWLGTLCGLALPSLFFLFHAAAPPALPPRPPAVQSGMGTSAATPQSVPVNDDGGRAGNSAGGVVRWRTAVATCPVPQPQTEVAEITSGQRPRIAHEPGETLAPPQIASFDWREASQLPGNVVSGRVVATSGLTTEAAAEPPVAPPFVVKPRASHHPVSVTAAALGNLTLGRTAIDIQSTSTFTSAQSQTVSEESVPGALVSVELPITRMIGVRLDAATHSSSYSYTSGGYYSTATVSSGFEAGRIETRQYELTPSAVLTFPTQTRISPYLQVGAGMLAFVPHGNPGQAISRSYRASGLVGAGVKVRLVSHLDLTAGYRGVIYRTPYFSEVSTTTTGSFSGPILVRRTLSSEPFVGLTYTFGKARKD